MDAPPTIDTPPANVTCVAVPGAPRFLCANARLGIVTVDAITQELAASGDAAECLVPLGVRAPEPLRFAAPLPNGLAYITAARPNEVVVQTDRRATFKARDAVALFAHKTTVVAVTPGSFVHYAVDRRRSSKTSHKPLTTVRAFNEFVVTLTATPTRLFYGVFVAGKDVRQLFEVVLETRSTATPFFSLVAINEKPFAVIAQDGRAFFLAVATNAAVFSCAIPPDAVCHAAVFGMAVVLLGAQTSTVVDPLAKQVVAVCAGTSISCLPAG